MNMEKVWKANRGLILLLTLVLVLSAILCVGCNEDSEGEVTPCAEHSFSRVESELNRAPTYDNEGRELRVCSVCGASASFVLPKLERISYQEDPAYMPLLQSYVVTYGDTLKNVADMYFTAGWSFALDEETLVGEVSEIGYDYLVKYTPSDNKYQGTETTIRLIVKEAE